MIFLTIVTICVLVLFLYCAIPSRASARAGILSFPDKALAPGPTGLRIATFNIHGAKGTDAVRDPARTAAVMQRSDIVALQEVRAGWRNNQAQDLARKLSLGWLYVPTLRRWCRNYRGNALLTRFPANRWQTYLLPNVSGHRYRIYTSAEIKIGDGTLHIVFTHLHTSAGREQQLRTVLEHFAGQPTPAILLGDLNTKPRDPILDQLLTPDMTDAVKHVEAGGSADRVDWILTRGLKIKDGGTTDDGASDHPYFWVDVTWDQADPGSALTGA